MSQHIHMVSGRMGVTPGFYAASNAITEDNDGEFAGYDGVIDLTRILSMKLGKQLSQCANYRVSFMQVDLRNVNNAVDNDQSLTAGGVIRWFEPTKHRVNALQALRAVEREYQQGMLADQSGQYAPFQLTGGEQKYKGLRFNWDTDAQVFGANDNEFTSTFGGGDYRLVEILDHYDKAIVGDAGDKGFQESDTSGAALWENRTGQDASRHDNAIYWVTSYRNRFAHQEGATFTPLLTSDDAYIHGSDSRPYQLDLGTRHVSVLGGLMELEVVHTNTDTAGILEDEYYVQVTLGIEGWEEF